MRADGNDLDDAFVYQSDLAVEIKQSYTNIREALIRRMVSQEFQQQVLGVKSFSKWQSKPHVKHWFKQIAKTAVIELADEL